MKSDLRQGKNYKRQWYKRVLNKQKQKTAILI